MLKRTINKWNKRPKTGSISNRTGTGGRTLKTRSWVFGLNQVRAIYCAVEDLLAFPERRCCLEVLRCNVLTTMTVKSVVILSIFSKLQNQMLASSCLSVKSVRPSTWSTSAPTGRISMKFDIWLFFENLPRKFNFYLHLTWITDIVHEDDYIVLILLPSVLLRMRNISKL